MSKLLIGLSANSGKFGVIPEPPEKEFCCDAEKDNTLCDSCKYFVEYHGIPMCEGDEYKEKEE